MLLTTNFNQLMTLTNIWSHWMFQSMTNQVHSRSELNPNVNLMLSSSQNSTSSLASSASLLASSMSLRWGYFSVSFNPTCPHLVQSWQNSGMGVHIVIVLYYTARPKVEVEIRQVSTCLFIELVVEAWSRCPVSNTWASPQIRRLSSPPSPS